MPPDPDPNVKVVVRVRPVNEHERESEQTVQKLSPHTSLVGNRKRRLGSVSASSSKQEDIFFSWLASLQLKMLIWKDWKWKRLIQCGVP